MLENLDVTADLFAGTEFASAAVNEIGNQFIPTARFLVDNNLSATENWDLADSFHESILDILWPHLLRIFLSSVRSLRLVTRERGGYSLRTDFLPTVRRSEGIDSLELGEFPKHWKGGRDNWDIVSRRFLERTFFGRRWGDGRQCRRE
jgi:hypothetical protein